MTDTSKDATHVPPGTWVVARTRVTDPYPCLCHTRKYDRCSPLWCPCAGRTDPQKSTCCAWRYGLAEVAQARVEYRIRKMQQDG